MSFATQRDRAGAAPVTWLASFPRSGNTLLRVVLKNCFGISSPSIYGDGDFADPVLARMVGLEAVGPDVQAFIRNARAQGRRLFVKTHELPGADHHPAIHMVRDGRSALVSRRHYQRDILDQPRPLADIIAEPGAGSWSAHVKAWMIRPNTLTLRYEKLAAGDPVPLAAIADFTGRPQIAPFDISFARLHAMDPAFFRAGNDAANIAEMTGEDRALFERLHGQTLRTLGYA